MFRLSTVFSRAAAAQQLAGRDMLSAYLKNEAVTLFVCSVCGYILTCEMEG